MYLYDHSILTISTAVEPWADIKRLPVSRRASQGALHLLRLRPSGPGYAGTTFLRIGCPNYDPHRRRERREVSALTYINDHVSY